LWSLGEGKLINFEVGGNRTDAGQVFLESVLMQR